LADLFAGVRSDGADRCAYEPASTRTIARELRVAEDKVRETVEKMLTPITPKLKLTALQEALERFDLYQASQHQAAVNGDREAIAMCLKIEEQRADLLRHSCTVCSAHRSGAAGRASSATEDFN
jgi:hypothetical protein